MNDPCPGSWMKCSEGYVYTIPSCEGLPSNLVCKVSQRYSESVREDFARLIAAAPELLRACIAAAKELNFCISKYPIESTAILEKAIKKATEENEHDSQ